MGHGEGWAEQPVKNPMQGSMPRERTPRERAVVEYWLDRIDRPTALEIGRLVAIVWPKPDMTATDRADQIEAFGRDYTGPFGQTPRSFVVRESGRVIAHSAAIPRTIGTIERKMTILGLSRVCAHPDCRGQKLGELVTRAAFELVDRGNFPFSLFQTTPQVRPFYERLGAVSASNTIVNSLADDPTSNPFSDAVVMRYPNSGDWPSGTIDLRGPGY
jgi:predicted N-acetyltransferase YhbS